MLSVAQAISGFAPSVTPLNRGRYIHSLQNLVSVNAAGTDVTTFTGLPSLYRVTRFMVFAPSASLALSLATLSLFTGAGGTGTAYVSGQLLTALTGSSKLVDLTLAVTGDLLTGSTLYVRNIIAHGSAATVSCLLEVLRCN